MGQEIQNGPSKTFERQLLKNCNFLKPAFHKFLEYLDPYIHEKMPYSFAYAQYLRTSYVMCFVI